MGSSPPNVNLSPLEKRWHRFKETLSTISHGLRGSQGTFTRYTHFAEPWTSSWNLIDKHEAFRVLWIWKQLQVFSLRLRSWVGKVWILLNSTFCPRLYPTGRSTPEFHTFSPQLGYILLSINSKPLIILGIT